MGSPPAPAAAAGGRSTRRVRRPGLLLLAMWRPCAPGGQAPRRGGPNPNVEGLPSERRGGRRVEATEDSAESTGGLKAGVSRVEAGARGRDWTAPFDAPRRGLGSEQGRHRDWRRLARAY